MRGLHSEESALNRFDIESFQKKFQKIEFTKKRFLPAIFFLLPVPKPFGEQPSFLCILFRMKIAISMNDLSFLSLKNLLD